jgi:hypothetical protein
MESMVSGGRRDPVSLPVNRLYELTTNSLARLWAAISILDAELSELLLSKPLLRRLSLSDLVSEDDL